MREQSETCVDIVRKALPQMSRLGIPITPSNYAVWFEYLGAQNHELKGELDFALKRGRLTTSVIEDLYNRYIDVGDTELLGKMREGIRHLVASFREKLAHASGEFSTYGSALDDFAAQLAQDVPVEELARFVENLAQKTQFIVAQNAEMQAGIESASGDVEALHRQIEARRNEAVTDPITGLNTRRAFAEQANAIAEKALSDDTHGPCLLIIDIDHFGQVIAEHGEQPAGQLLRTLADTLRRNLKGRDLIAHFGGNAFAILLSDVPATATAGVAEQLRAAVEDAELHIDNVAAPVKLTVSIGLARLRVDESIDDLIERADSVLFLAKEAGRNRVTIDR